MLRISVAFAIFWVHMAVTLKPELEDHWKKFKVWHFGWPGVYIQITKISLSTGSFFKGAYNKSYNPTEEVERRQIWEQHVMKILHHNLEADLGIHNYTVGINEYADMMGKAADLSEFGKGQTVMARRLGQSISQTERLVWCSRSAVTTTEFVATMNGYRRSNTTSKPSAAFRSPANLTLPGVIDWRNEGMVTYVKNQEQCGSCWAFSATGSLEGQHKKKTGNLVALSEQNLVDCSGPQGNYGCSGGWPGGAFLYVAENNGLDTENSYPYTAQNGVCHYNVRDEGATCTGYTRVPSGDELALQQAVAAVGPISVCIDASHWSFQLYKNGVYNEPSCTTWELDHAVLAVGYGSEAGQDYWLVKNSWGSSWGEKGYIKMSRNKNNQCGIATEASYPIV